ncbi:MAG: serine/threonine protein kinase [Gemmatimonadetes bacterium]|nr:serine/threonine protein kinase [Gemmatimonadota bacterium]
MASTNDQPQQIGPYRLLQVIGEGGMGVVYEAEQKNPVRRRVALKMLKLGMDSREVLGRFEAERQALAVMEHPGIAQVFDAGLTDDGRPYFIMELVRGLPLLEFCGRHRLDTRSRVRLFGLVCDAVQHAHQKGVIHRDLKPSNILVMGAFDDPRPKVIDFGVAKATGRRLTDHTVVTTFGQTVGTLAYMSPEQAEMSGLDVDTRADVYSLGVTLYELVVGKVPLDPFEVGGPQFLARLLEPDLSMPTLSERLDSLEPADVERTERLRRTTLDRLRKELAGDLQWIVLKTIEKDRTRRYATANGLRSDLDRYLADEPVSARPPSVMYRMRKFTRRHRMGVAVAAAGITGLAVFGAAMAVQADRIGRERDRAVRETRKSAAVNAFMNEVLLAAEPLDGLGPDATILDALNWIVAESDGPFSDDPEVDSSVRHAVGAVFSQLGQLDRAEELLLDALDSRLEALGATHADVGSTLYQLGNLAVGRGDLDSAAVLLERALVVRRGALPETDASLAHTLTQLGYVRVNLGDAEAAEPHLDEALDIFRAQDPETVAVSEALNVLGQLHRLTNEPEAAEGYTREALEVRRRMYRAGHPKIAERLNNLAVVLDDDGRRAEAVELYREALEIYEDVYGPRSDVVAVGLSNLGLALTDLGEETDAEAAHRKALDITQEVSGPQSFNSAIQHNNLARHLCTYDGADEGLPHAEMAVGIGATAFEADSYINGVFMSTQGLCLDGVGAKARAEEVLLEAITVLENALGSDHPHAATARDRLADVRAG